MKNNLTSWKGQLVFDHDMIRDYCENTLAPRLDTVYDCTKMLYWLDNTPSDPIYIGLDSQGITGVHPGQTRLLSSHLLSRSVGVRVNCEGVSPQIVSRAKQITPYRTKNHSHQTQGFSTYTVLKNYGDRAERAMQNFDPRNAYRFYQELLA